MAKRKKRDERAKKDEDLKMSFQEIGYRVKLLREAAGFTQGFIAQYLHDNGYGAKGHNTVSNWEGGRPITTQVLLLLTQLYGGGVDPNYILWGDDRWLTPDMKRKLRSAADALEHRAKEKLAQVTPPLRSRQKPED